MFTGQPNLDWPRPVQRVLEDTCYLYGHAKNYLAIMFFLKPRLLDTVDFGCEWSAEG